MRSRAKKYWTPIIVVLLPLAAVAAAALFFPDAFTFGPHSREFREVASLDENPSSAFLIGVPAVETATVKQHRVRDILCAFGAGSNGLPGDPPRPVFVLDGRAYLAAAEPAGNPVSTGSFINSAYLLGLERGSRPVAVFELAEGTPVSLAGLYDVLRKRYAGRFAVLGIGSFRAVYSRPVSGGEIPPADFRAVDAFFYGIPDPGKMWGEGDRILQTAGLLVEACPRPGRNPTPEAVLKTADRIRARDVTRIYPESTLTGAVVLVYAIKDFYLFADYIDPPLVEITALDPSIETDIRYAGTRNFVGRQIYSAARAYLAQPVAERLVRVNNRLKEQGFRLKVWDAYRPAPAQEMLWEAASDKRFVASPQTGSRHSRAAAVDVTLVTLDGKEVVMPTGFDDFSERAHRDYRGGSPESRRHRDILQQAMMAEGFLPLAHEWWHFESPDWAGYPLLDVPLR